MSKHASAAARHIVALIEEKQRDIQQLLGTLDAIGAPSPKRRAALPGKLRAAAQRRAGGKPHGKAMTRLVLEILARQPVDFDGLFQQLQPYGVNDKRQITGSTASWIRNGLLRRNGQRLTVTKLGARQLQALQNGKADHGDQETAAAAE